MRLSHVLKRTIKDVQQLIKHDLNVLERDVFIVRVKAGNGGAGLARYNGVGGRGGNIYATVQREMAFADVRKLFSTGMIVRADNGEACLKTKLVGSHAADTILKVPLGVEFVNEEDGVLIARCEKPFRKYLIAKGGEGGNFNNGFKAEPGEFLSVSIHLKLRPNVAFLGFPNAGKSTILKALVPRKHVKIAPYAFTTTKPQVAFMNLEENTNTEKESDEGVHESQPFTLSLADLPGIIEGASANRGHGFSFLKHLEYADIICVVVDCTGFQLKNDLNEPFRSALECIALLNKEVEIYSPRLLSKPVVIALNKIDLIKDKQELQSLVELVSAREWRRALPDVGDESSSPIQTPFKVAKVVTSAAARNDISQLREALVEMQRFIRPENRIVS